MRRVFVLFLMCLLPLQLCAEAFNDPLLMRVATAITITTTIASLDNPDNDHASLISMPEHDADLSAPGAEPGAEPSVLPGPCAPWLHTLPTTPATPGHLQIVLPAPCHPVIKPPPVSLLA